MYVMLNWILLDSLNGFPSYKKLFPSKRTLFIRVLLFICEGQGLKIEYKKRKSMTTTLNQCPAQVLMLTLHSTVHVTNFVLH